MPTTFNTTPSGIDSSTRRASRASRLADPRLTGQLDDAAVTAAGADIGEHREDPPDLFAPPHGPARRHCQVVRDHVADRTLSTMSDIEAELLAVARAVQANAHVPYSHFPVGAALRTDTGAVFAGCNVENAAYPQGVCAEASAISAMVSAGERVIRAIVTVCDGDLLATPCGGCRQKIREFADADTMIHAAGPDGVRTSYTMDELLPDSFGPENLSE